VVSWSSESTRYGGSGTPPLDQEGRGWRIPAQATVLLHGEVIRGNGHDRSEREGKS
jgi:hypothetical protein